MGQLISTVPAEKLALVLPQRYQDQLATLIPSFRRSDSSNNASNNLGLFIFKLEQFLEASKGRNFDLLDLPTELALAILSHLNPTDLYLASGVWWDLASNESLWRG